MSTSAERIRQQLRSLVVSRHPSDSTDGSDDSVIETILISDGMYFGRRFCLSGYSLTFFAQEEHVKVLDGQNEMIYSGSLELFLKQGWGEAPQGARAA
ncbi:hypothetical protein SH449x_000017 [Pirellulaceae bacterium SH449]